MTDKAGDARLPQNDDARWVFAQGENDAHLIALSSGENSLPLYRLGVTEDASEYEEEGSSANTIFLFTERGVYKPGDKLYLKGYARDPRNDQPRIPAGKEITLTMTDAKERRDFHARRSRSPSSASFDQEITLPEGSLGRYRIKAAGEKGEKLGGSCSFQVQEYKPNAFEISIPAPARNRWATRSSRSRSRRNISWANRSRRPSSPGRWWRAMTASIPMDLPDFAFCNAIY